MHFYKKIAVAGGYADNPLCFLDDHSTVATVVYVDDSDSIFFKQKHVGKGKTYFPMNSALNLPVQTIAANSVINLNGNPEELNKISFETALKSYSEMNKSIENLERIGPYNKFFEYLFKNKCKNT